MIVFLVGTVSALDFGIDNFVRVSNDTKTVEVWDTGLFLIGSDTKLATATLNTGLLIDHIVHEDIPKSDGMAIDRSLRLSFSNRN